jgi:metallo-beta-lactamase class B
MILVLSLLIAQTSSVATMGRPVPPQRIAGNLYYVGHNEITAFLFATPKGLILLDGGFAENAVTVEQNIEKLGFKKSEVKIIINSQAHFDHAAALAQLKKDTGAKVYALGADAQELANGGADNSTTRFTPVETDVVIKDGGAVELGGTTVIAHLTPGHTKGCTTWTAKVDGKDAVFVCSMSAPGYQLVANARYPNIVEDYRKSFAILRSLPCDIFLGAHGSFFGLEGKLKDPSRFVDPKGYRAYIDGAEAAFDRQLAEQKQVSKPAEKR